MTFKASPDILTKTITAATTVLFIAVIAWLFLTGRERHTIAFFLIFILLIYSGMLLYRPSSYELTSDQLIIHRLLSDVRIDRNKITGVGQLTDDQIAWSFRTFGVNGFWGYFGKFINNRIGRMTWYATRRNNAVLITTTSGEKIIITPDEPERFVSMFNKPNTPNLMFLRWDY